MTFSTLKEIPIHHMNSLYLNLLINLIHKIEFANIVLEDILFIHIQALSKMSILALDRKKKHIIEKEKTNCII